MSIYFVMEKSIYEKVQLLWFVHRTFRWPVEIKISNQYNFLPELQSKNNEHRYKKIIVTLGIQKRILVLKVFLNLNFNLTRSN